MFVRVAPDIPKIEQSYWYVHDTGTRGSESIRVGSVVRIPLHGRRVRGWVCELTDNEDQLLMGNNDVLDISKIKKVIEFVSDGPPPHLVTLCEQLSRYYLCSPITFLRAASPDRIVTGISYDAHAGSEGHASRVVLVDPRADRRDIIREHIASNGSTIIITPDSHSRITSWCQELGFNAIQYRHGDKSKDDSFRRASTRNCIVVGGRVALFAPVTDCKSIIVLDDAYEQLSEERSPRWNVSDCAKFAAQKWGIDLTFITSVPSVATHSIDVVDKREERSWPRITIENRNAADPALGVFTQPIVAALTQALESGHDAAVILNNKVNARFLVCRSCDAVATCELCNHSVYQDDSQEQPFQCPTCTTSRPSICLECGATTFKKYRRGLQSTTQDCEALFSKHRVVEFSKTKDQKNEMYEQSDKATLFVATEALFHRKDLTRRLACCVFIDIDSMLFRSGMNAFEQVLVVVNRALRSLHKTDLRTPMILATRAPDNMLLADIAHGDFVTNRDRELALRRQLRLAPFFATAEITSTTPAMDKFLGEVPGDILVGTTVEYDKTTAFLAAADHDTLAEKAYGAVRGVTSNNRCTVSIDVYD